MATIDEVGLFLTDEGQRTCPHAVNPSQPWAPDRFCWWIEAGTPHAGEGHGCMCLVPVELWTIDEDGNSRGDN